MTESKRHIPVMINEVLDTLAPQSGKTYVDCTFGNGGYTRAILEATDCSCISIDQDPTVKAKADELKKEFGNRFTFVEGKFGDVEQLIKKTSTKNIDGIVFDIGVSSMQLDDADRGFSFNKEAILDMRMSKSGISAKDLVNELDEVELANIIYKYGEERKSRFVARAIVEARAEKEIETTTELANIVDKAIFGKAGKTHPATKTFQALRIETNKELEQLENGLQGATNLLAKDGKLVVVTFHSLEDRIVKNFMKDNSVKTGSGTSRYLPVIEEKTEDKAFSRISKAIKPSKSEILSNKRSRSAKLRVAIKNQ